MSVHILYDHSKRKSVMFCSTDGRAFGPVFDNEDAADFADWMLEARVDPRTLNAEELAGWIETWEAAPELQPDSAMHSVHADLYDNREGK